jgi:hypothetical protein
MPLSTPSIILVSPLGRVHRLRNALLSSGVKTHVFDTYPAALTLLHRKKIDTVVVQFAHDQATREFCDTVRSLEVPLVYATPRVSLLS